ncbi:uncharacterized protein RSE6_14587 [Rhynchosporium secalis]|uniref:Uncharacterized protein n=1 Tax=Rhynchosporium secalis TaxID=38038 RepID=A0A1E1MVM4_RHYSE|nr:uncharacterized protein RSE6_14587 [Rhynchosporium secalis]
MNLNLELCATIVSCCRNDCVAHCDIIFTDLCDARNHKQTIEGYLSPQTFRYTDISAICNFLSGFAFLIIFRNGNQGIYEASDLISSTMGGASSYRNAEHSNGHPTL